MKMDTVYLVNGSVYQGRSFEEKTLQIREGKLTVLDPGCPTADGTVWDAAGFRIVPGFIDTHTHGAVGVDVNGASAEDLEKICRFMAGNGTTAWQASVLTDTQDQTEWCIGEMRRHQHLEQRGAELLGIHLEGPFLSPAYKGAMPEHLLQKNNLPLIRHYQDLAGGKIHYITISPELDGAVDMIPALRDMGIVVGIGHSGATYQQAMDALAQQNYEREWAYRQQQDAQKSSGSGGGKSSGSSKANKDDGSAMIGDLSEDNLQDIALNIYLGTGMQDPLKRVDGTSYSEKQKQYIKEQIKILMDSYG